MRFRIPSLLAALTVAASPPLQAQTQLPEWVSQILTAAQLPVQTVEARKEGASNADVQAVLDAMQKAKVPAHEATAVIDTARAVRREHGPTDNFGAFVQTQLAAGKRGRELAAAIRAEHARAGKGHAGHGAAKKEKAADDTARGRGRDARPAGQAGPAKKPDDRGQGKKPVKP